MGWSVSLASSSSGGEICILISGGSGTPNVTVSFDRGKKIELNHIEYLGGGVWRVCFSMPPDANRAQVTVSGGGQAPVSTYV